MSIPIPEQFIEWFMTRLDTESGTSDDPADSQRQGDTGEENVEGTYQNCGSMGHYCLRLPFLSGI